MTDDHSKTSIHDAAQHMRYANSVRDVCCRHVSMTDLADGRSFRCCLLDCQFRLMCVEAIGPPHSPEIIVNVMYRS